jgi:prepilin-type N-terminal cleavage/methylation domain-containing protein
VLALRRPGPLGLYVVLKTIHQVKAIRSSRGFSLVELMVAMVAGLVVIAAVVVFTVATAQSSTTNIRSMRVMQNLRSSLSLIEREIRRSGYNQSALSYAGKCSNASSSTTCSIGVFNQLVVAAASCLIVSYDNAANTTKGAIDAGEYHAFRLVQNAAGIGVIQANLTSATVPDCTDPVGDVAWPDVSDPNVVDVTALNFTRSTTDGGCVEQPTTSLWLVVQDVLVEMTGRWVDPATKVVTSRSLQESVRVKNDVVSLTKPAVCP